MKFKAPFFLIVIIFCVFTGKANDGTYYTSGNHLIPMYETSISVKKEILSIKRVDRDFVNITVYYEFFNPGEAKTLEVGFEAALPYGDADIDLSKLKHPFIQDFTVSMNSSILPYKISLVSDSIYYKDGKFIEKPPKEVKGLFFDQWPDNVYLIYHFKAYFKKGLNIISHTYSYKISTTVGRPSSISYILTGAKRWSNKQIDDFTLLIDMGNFAEFLIDNTFFEKPDEWKISGIGKNIIKRDLSKSSHFIMHNGYIFFEKTNFKPKGELYINFGSLLVDYLNVFQFDSNDENTTKVLPFSIENSFFINTAKGETSLKILRNLPYARRGYIFKSPEIQKFYESMDWYIPDPNYEADLSKITKEEQEWLKKLTLE